MFNRLLLSTALVSAVAVFASSAAFANGTSHSEKQPSYVAAPVAASSPVGVTIGGFIDFQAGFSDQDAAFETGANSRDVKFQNDSEVHIRADGKASNGIGYGAVIELESDVTADADGEGLNADKTYTYVDGNFGRVELGNNTGVEEALEVNSSRIARATGGTDGDWYDFANTAGVGGASFIINPDLPLDHGNGVAEDATKINYYTPRFAGVQLGVSFTPDTGNGGTAAGFTSDTNAGQYENVFGVGANYERSICDICDWNVRASLAGSFGESEAATTEDLAAWATGLGVSYKGFSVAGSYGDWADSGLSTLLPAGSDDDQNYWDAGVAYAHGPYGVSATYLQSEAAGNEFDIVSLGADYQLAPGLVPYVEANFFDLDQAGTTTDNDGTVVLVGTQLNF